MPTAARQGPCSGGSFGTWNRHLSEARRSRSCGVGAHSAACTLTSPSRNARSLCSTFVSSVVIPARMAGSSKNSPATQRAKSAGLPGPTRSVRPCDAHRMRRAHSHWKLERACGCGEGSCCRVDNRLSRHATVASVVLALGLGEDREEEVELRRREGVAQVVLAGEECHRAPIAEPEIERLRRSELGAIGHVADEHERRRALGRRPDRDRGVVILHNTTAALGSRRSGTCTEQQDGARGAGREGKTAGHSRAAPPA